MTTTITIPEKVPGLNGKGGLKREHWAAYKKRRDRYQYTAMSQTRNCHPGKVRIILTRYSTGIEMDYDNLVATGKPILDALKTAGIIKDDSQQIIVSRDYRSVRLSPKDKDRQMTQLMIIDAE